MVNVSLPDGNVIEVADGATTADVAMSISEGLARKAIAGKVMTNGVPHVIDVHRALPGDCQLTILTANDEDDASLEVLRHSAAHVMAEAICALFPDAQLVYGPAVENGFYYDIDLDHTLTPDDFPRIEAEMKRIVKEKRRFLRCEMSREEGLAKVRNEGSRYKIDNAERAEGDTISFYVTGDAPGAHFEDLCMGPHVPNTGVIKAFSIRQVSRSHYRGDINDTPLQRVYGTAFFKKSSLTAYLEQMEEAKRRDHRVLGKQLELFSVSERVGSGLILWLPKGTVIRTELQSYLTDEMMKLGYDMVVSPHIGDLGLYRCSGHYPYYEDSQFPAMFETDRGKALQSALQFAQRVRTLVGAEHDEAHAAFRSMTEAIQKCWGKIESLDGSESIDKAIEALYAAMAPESGYLLKPMNCPHHIAIYAARPRSYRELPLRIGEYGTVYRHEQSGELAGMTRVRGFTQDDAHLFCTADQLAAELGATVKLTRQVLEILGMMDYRVRVGLRDPGSAKYVGTAESWDRAEAAIRSAAQDSGVSYVEEPGEAAFYGPKIDFVVKDCIGRSWQLGTVQVDYNLPERFELTYTGADNAPHQPIMIHRAPFGSMERFCGILIEHFAGAFPMWLSPVQVAVATVSEKSAAYGRDVYVALKEAGFRVALDDSDERIGPKKHRLRSEQVNYILVVGEQEAAARLLNVNDRSGKTIGNMSIEAFIGAASAEVATKGRSTVAAGR